MIRIVGVTLALAALGACAPTVPNSGAGVGFDNSLDAQRAREAALAGRTQPVLPAATAISDEPLPPGPGIRQPAQTSGPLTALPQSAPSNGDVILEAAASLEQTQANSGVVPLQASPDNAAPVILDNPGISDENDFEAVSRRESIESDAQRIAQVRSQYEVVQPTAVPSRDGVSQPNIVQYALQTTHQRGVRVYNRVGVNLAARAQRNCAGYPSADQAQIDFLESGGPTRDRKGLDPDGDGFACNWDPAPFRSAVRN